MDIVYNAETGVLITKGGVAVGLRPSSLPFMVKNHSPSTYDTALKIQSTGQVYCLSMLHLGHSNKRMLLAFCGMSVFVSAGAVEQDLGVLRRTRQGRGLREARGI